MALAASPAATPALKLVRNSMYIGAAPGPLWPVCGWDARLPSVWMSMLASLPLSSTWPVAVTATRYCMPPPRSE